MYFYAGPVSRLIKELTKLPSVGPKTAQRLAFYIVKTSESESRQLAEAILDVKRKVVNCKICYNLADREICNICGDERRDGSILCVVSDPRELAAVEVCGAFKGIYHVLGGVISPLDGIGPEDLKVNELLSRIEKGGIREVVLAISSSLSGEATTLYLNKELKPYNIKITRLALGIPAGADIEYADELTLAMAFSGRLEI